MLIYKYMLNIFNLVSHIGFIVIAGHYYGWGGAILVLLGGINISYEDHKEK